MPHKYTTQQCIDAFWSRVDFTGSCWLWTGPIDRYGYGVQWVGGKHIKAHRYAYEFCVESIPVGLQIDHLCRVRHCVTPDHLDVVTHQENGRRGVSFAALNGRKTHCQHGHEFTFENTYQRTNGNRECLTCKRVRVP